MSEKFMHDFELACKTTPKVGDLPPLGGNLRKAALELLLACSAHGGFVEPPRPKERPYGYGPPEPVDDPDPKGSRIWLAMEALQEALS